MQSCLRRENFSGDDPDVGREAEVEEDEVEDEDEQRKPTDHLGIAGTEAKEIKLDRSKWNDSYIFMPQNL